MNAVTRIVTLMNQLHSLDQRYVPTEEKRKEIRAMLIADIEANSRDLSPNLQQAVKDSLTNKKYWEEIRKRIT